MTYTIPPTHPPPRRRREDDVGATANKTIQEFMTVFYAFGEDDSFSFQVSLTMFIH
jgi:hypothetical protein